MKVLLTGASGFIGSHLARLLVSSGESVTAILKRRAIAGVSQTSSRCGRSM
jgi:nucleoside-diphosphate-sugar epimerase